jgi:hypothetical protein
MSAMPRCAIVVLAGLLLLAQAPQAGADTILPLLPMIVLVWPAAGLLLLPIILIEALVARRVLRLSFRAAFRIAGLANLASTAVGIPLTWLVVLLLQLGAMLAMKNSAAPALGWLIMGVLPALIGPPRTMMGVVCPILVLCVPFFFTSVWIEARFAKWLLPADRDADARCWSWQANLLSYALILLLVTSLLLL